MTTYGDIRDRVLRALDDPTGANYDDALIFDGFRAAQRAILPWIARHATETIDGKGDATYELPADLYQVEAVKVGSSIIPRAVLAPGVVAVLGQNWLEYPTGSITFANPLEEGESALVYYLAHWEEPEDESDVEFDLEIPTLVDSAVVIYAAAWTLIPGSVSTAELRQFGTRVDSGHPDHNPFAQRVNFLLKLFELEVARHGFTPRALKN